MESFLSPRTPNRKRRQSPPGLARGQRQPRPLEQRYGSHLPKYGAPVTVPLWNYEGKKTQKEMAFRLDIRIILHLDLRGYVSMLGHVRTTVLANLVCEQLEPQGL